METSVEQGVKASAGLGTTGKKGLSHPGYLPTCWEVPGVPHSPCPSSDSRYLSHFLTKLQVLSPLSGAHNN